MKYKHIIFDIDGTMLNTEPVLLKVLQELILDLQGKKVDISDLIFTSGIPGDIALKKLGFQDTETVNKLWNEAFLKKFHEVHLFDGIENVLKELDDKKINLGIITSKTHTEYKNDFLPFNIEHYFGTIICVDDVVEPKPSSESMIKYLQSNNISPNEALYIGDTPYDMQCAKNAGVDFGLAVWGCHSTEPIQADYYLSYPKDILSI